MEIRHKYEEGEDIVSILTNTTKGRVKDMWEQVYIQKVKNE
jgi:hypothetical protein